MYKWIYSSYKCGDGRELGMGVVKQIFEGKKYEKDQFRTRNTKAH
jgi:hypothetical protein